jgi:hypothetical protein
VTELFANDAQDTLPSGSGTGTSLTVASGTSLPTPTGGDFIALRIEPAVANGTFEIVYMTARSGTGITATRGREGTTATAWGAGAKISAAPTAASLVALQNPLIVANVQTASYTLALTDAGDVVEMNVATANTLTIPPNSSVAFPIGTVIEVFQVGVGQCTITPGAGVTILSDGGVTKTAGQYATVGLRKRNTNQWVLSGDAS